MKFDYRNSGIYAGAAHAYWINIVPMLIFSSIYLAIKLASSFFEANPALYGAYFIIQVSFAYIIHRTILNDETDIYWKGETTGSTYKSFLWRSLVIVLILGLLSGPFVIIYPILTLLAIKFDYQIEYLFFISPLLFFVISLPANGIFLALFGTILPAAVAKENTSIRAAYQRSNGQVFITLFRLLFGPTLFTLFLFAIAYSVIFVDSLAEIFARVSQFNLFGIIVLFLFHAATLFVATLTVVILCKAYLNTTPQTDNT